MSPASMKSGKRRTVNEAKNTNLTPFTTSNNLPSGKGPDPTWSINNVNNNNKEFFNINIYNANQNVGNPGLGVNYNNNTSNINNKSLNANYSISNHGHKAGYLKENNSTNITNMSASIMCANGNSNSRVSTNTTHANVKRKNTISTKGGKSEYSPRDTSKTRSQKNPKKLLGEIKINSERDGKKFGKLLRSLEVADLDDIKTDSDHKQSSPIHNNFFGQQTPANQNSLLNNGSSRASQQPHNNPRHNSKPHSKHPSKHQSPVLHTKNPTHGPTARTDPHNFKYHINPKQPYTNIQNFKDFKGLPKDCGRKLLSIGKDIINIFDVLLEANDIHDIIKGYVENIQEGC